MWKWLKPKISGIQKNWFQQQIRDSIKTKTWTEGSFRNQELTNTGLVTGINQCWVVIKNRHSSPIIWKRSDNCLSNCECLDRSFLKTAGSLRLLKTGTDGSLIPISKTREEVVVWFWNIQKLDKWNTDLTLLETTLERC